MPDYDVFAKSLPKPWRKAARQALDNDNNPLVVGSILDALQYELPDIGAMLPKAVMAVTDALTRGCDSEAIDWVESELEVLVRSVPTLRGYLLRDSALAVLHNRTPLVGPTTRQVATVLLANYSLRCVSPNSLVTRLLKEGKISLGTLIERKDQLMDQLAASEEFQKAAAEMSAPQFANGRTVSRPLQRRSPSLPQEAILSLGLTR